jgi:hypothetical protein
MFNAGELIYRDKKLDNVFIWQFSTRTFNYPHLGRDLKMFYNCFCVYMSQAFAEIRHFRKCLVISGNG